MESIKKCFDTIVNDDKEHSYAAMKRLRKVVYSSRSPRTSIEDIHNCIATAVSAYHALGLFARVIIFFAYKHRSNRQSDPIYYVMPTFYDYEKAAGMSCRSSLVF